MKTELVDLLTMEDMLSLFPGSGREDVERHWNMMRDAIRMIGKGDDAEFITSMLGSTVTEAQGKGKQDGDPIDGDFVMSRFDAVRQMIERRRLERQRSS